MARVTRRRPISRISGGRRLTRVDTVGAEEPLGIHGLPASVCVKQLRGVATADDLVNSTFHRLGLLYG